MTIGSLTKNNNCNFFAVDTVIPPINKQKWTLHWGTNWFHKIYSLFLKYPVSHIHPLTHSW